MSPTATNRNHDAHDNTVYRNIATRHDDTEVLPAGSTPVGGWRSEVRAPAGGRRVEAPNWLGKRKGVSRRRSSFRQRKVGCLAQPGNGPASLSTICAETCPEWTEEQWRRARRLPVEVLYQILGALVTSRAGRPMVSERVFRSIFVPHWKALDIRGCTTIRNAVFCQTFGNCRDMVYLNLSGCSQLRNQVVGEILQSCGKLRELLLANCHRLTDDAFADKLFRPMLAYMSLEVLNVSGCRQLTSLTVQRLAKVCAKLKRLDISRCKSIVDKHSLASLLGSGPVQFLNMSCLDLVNSLGSEWTEYVDGPLAIDAHPGCELGGLIDGDSADVVNVSIVPVIPRSLVQKPYLVSKLLSLDLCGLKIQPPEFTIQGQPESDTADVNPRDIEAGLPRSQRVGYSGRQSVSMANRDGVDAGADGTQGGSREAGPPGDFVYRSSQAPVFTEDGFGLAHGLIVSLVRVCPHLRNLKLRYNSVVDDATIATIAESCPRLAELDLRGCEAITDTAMTYLAEGCRELKCLDVSWCPHITNAGIRSLVLGCTELEQLRMLWCAQVSDAALEFISRHARRLQLVNILEGWRGISKEGTRLLHRSGVDTA